MIPQRYVEKKIPPGETYSKKFSWEQRTCPWPNRGSEQVASGSFSAFDYEVIATDDGFVEYHSNTVRFVIE